MKTEQWIPQPQEAVMYQKELWRVLKVSMGGKCTLRKFRVGTTEGGQIINDIDVSQLSKPTESAEQRGQESKLMSAIEDLLEQLGSEDGMGWVRSQLFDIREMVKTMEQERGEKIKDAQAALGKYLSKSM